MKMKSVINALLMTMLALAAGCTALEPARHQYIMRGQILDVSNNEAYLCIGSNDGAKVGQELTVYKFVRTSPHPRTKTASPTFKKEATGTVRITEVVNEHFAKAQLLTGNADVNFVVELQR